MLWEGRDPLGTPRDPLTPRFPPQMLPFSRAGRPVPPELRQQHQDLLRRIQGLRARLQGGDPHFRTGETPEFLFISFFPGYPGVLSRFFPFFRVHGAPAATPEALHGGGAAPGDAGGEGETPTHDPLSRGGAPRPSQIPPRKSWAPPNLGEFPIPGAPLNSCWTPQFLLPPNPCGCCFGPPLIPLPTGGSQGGSVQTEPGGGRGEDPPRGGIWGSPSPPCPSLTALFSSSSRSSVDESPRPWAPLPGFWGGSETPPFVLGGLWGLPPPSLMPTVTITGIRAATSPPVPWG